MRVILEPATGAVIMGKDADGKEVKLESVSFVPFFSSASGSGSVALGKAVNKNGMVIDTFMLRANGNTGKITSGLRPSTKGVVPNVDRDKSEKTDQAKA